LISVDRRTVIQIFGSLMQRPSLLSDIDKYQIEPNDFQLPLDKYIYSAIYNKHIIIASLLCKARIISEHSMNYVTITL
jgi:hypothetical protein